MMSDWVSTKERLPREGTTVLVFDEGWIGTAAFYDDEFWDDSTVVPVTHWQPLPDAPLEAA